MSNDSAIDALAAKVATLETEIATLRQRVEDLTPRWITGDRKVSLAINNEGVITGAVVLDGLGVVDGARTA